MMTADREFSVTELALSYLKKIEAANRSLNAYLEVFSDVLEQAAAVDSRLAAGEALSLAGVPLAVKDNILIKGRTVSAASKMLANYTASYDATAIAKLHQAGAIFLGRTNMDEFAMGSSTENSAYGPTLNPHDRTRVAGGSSGGSAAAVAADLCLAALGSDTAGSVRQPASFCGVVGLKPTYGAVSRSGLIALASSLDQIGPLAKTVAGVEQIFKVIAGADEADGTAYYPVAPRPAPERPWIIGVPEEFVDTGLAPAVAGNFARALDHLRRLGCQLKKISLPRVKYSLACYYIISPAEASTNLARYDGWRYGRAERRTGLLDSYLATRGAGFGPEVRRRIILGTDVLSAGYYETYYARAVAVENLIKADFRQAFSEVDLIVTPTAPTTAFRVGEKTADPLQMYLADIFTVPVNLAGLPALSLPYGQDETGLPVGFQLIAPAYRENYLFALGRDLYDHVHQS